jgi:thiol-disulfide isomerase/thioredoxin
METNEKWVEDKMANLNPDSEWQPRVDGAMAQLEMRRERRAVVVRRFRILSVAAIAVACVFWFPQPRALAARAIEPCVEACQNFADAPGSLHDHLYHVMWNFHNFLGVAPPDFRLTDASGTQFHLSDNFGKVILVNFFATWCRPCKEETPWFVEFQKRYGDRGFTVIGVSMDEDGWKSVRPFIDAQKINYRVGIGDKALAQKYGGLESLPQTILLHQKGGVIVKHSGITSKDQFEREIAKTMVWELTKEEKDRLWPNGLR